MRGPAASCLCSGRSEFSVTGPDRLSQQPLTMSASRCWALALFGGNSETGFDQNSTYSIFSVSITLTDQGYQNFYQVGIRTRPIQNIWAERLTVLMFCLQVVHLVFQYLKMLQTQGPQQRFVWYQEACSEGSGCSNSPLRFQNLRGDPEN